MATFPALPLFTDAWVADTAHLSRLERGTYHDLLVLMWRSPECRVPNDDVWLARRLRMTEAEIKSDLRSVIDEFCQTDGNWLTQKRLRKEWDYLKKTRRRQSDNAKSRFSKEKTPSHSHATTTGLAMPPTPPNPTTVETPAPNGAGVPARAKPKRSSAKVALPSDWQLSLDGFEYANRNGFGADRTRVMANAFADHHRARGNVMADWDAAWRTWVRNEVKFNSRPGGGTSNVTRNNNRGGGGGADNVLAAAARRFGGSGGDGPASGSAPAV